MLGSNMGINLTGHTDMLETCNEHIKTFGNTTALYLVLEVT